MWAWGAEALEKGSAPVEWAPFAECLFGAALLVMMLVVLIVAMIVVKLVEIEQKYKRT